MSTCTPYTVEPAPAAAVDPSGGGKLVQDLLAAKAEGEVWVRGAGFTLA